jgi:hypothetical protein
VTVTMTPAQAADQAGPLNAVFIDAALGPVRRFALDISTARRIARATSTLAPAPPHHPRTKWGWYAGGDYGAGAGPDGESDLAFAAVPEHTDPKTVMARVRAMA